MHKNTKIEDPFLIFSQHQVPPSKDMENDCASMSNRVFKIREKDKNFNTFEIMWKRLICTAIISQSKNKEKI
jgi:hypothetical protein